MSPQLVRKPLHYDRVQRRLWIYGQRCHHGATGALLCMTGAAGLAAARLGGPGVALLVSGSALMVHDWHDRTLWFRRGWQE